MQHTSMRIHGQSQTIAENSSFRHNSLVTQVDELVVSIVNKTKPKFTQSKTYLDNGSTSLTMFLELFLARNVSTIYQIVRLALPQSLACNSPCLHTYYSTSRYYQGAQIESIHQGHRNFIVYPE